MESSVLQKLVKKIHSDKKVQAQFVADPESILAHFKLTGGERKAILEAYSKFGLAASNSSQLEAVVDPTGSWWSPTP